MKILVMKNVSTKISTEAATTACVVALPTPCVPPRGAQAVIASDQRHHEREHERLQQSLRQIVPLQRLPRPCSSTGVPVRSTRKALPPHTRRTCRQNPR